MKQGTIVLTQFPFTDLSTSKRRPAVILSKVIAHKNDVVVAYISSKITNQLNDTDFLLKTSHKEFINTGLIKDSIIKIDKLVTIDKSIFTGELGFVSDEILSELLLRVKKLFGI